MVKKIVFFTFFILLTAGLVYAKEYNVVKKAGPYQVTLKMDKDPAAVGENNAIIEVKNPAGESVTHAGVEVSYLMPSMQSMKYVEKGEPAGNVYTATIKPSMPGKWRATVTIKEERGKSHKVSFDFEAK
ncbi:MAG: FixH family protein [Thermodesulfovibrionales bacterium]